MSLLLRYGAALAFFICVAILSLEIVETFSFGKRPLYAQPKASSVRGVLYAFGRGMMPWEKESAEKHPLTYLAGVAYHAGIFAALFYLFCVALFVQLGVLVLSLVRFLLILGFLSGSGLLLRRAFVLSMRKLSCPDDYAANLIVDAFLLSAAIDTYFGSAIRLANTTWLLLLVSIIMFLYIPLGKIRHCFFFFYIRVLLGQFYGRRGVLPPRTHET
jgi:nitrate reductase gamma subunit